MNVIKTESLKEKTLYNSDLLLGNDFILLPLGVDVSTDLIDMLKKWGIKEVASDGSATSADDPIFIKTATKTTSLQKEAVKDSATANIHSCVEIAQKAIAGDDESQKLSAIQELYNEYIKYINYVYTRYATHGEINKDMLASVLKDLCEFLKKDDHYVVSASLNAERGKKDFLIHHSLRSTAVAIMIGIQLNLEDDKLLDLATACILHEIGMIKLPPQLYINDKQLTPKEFVQMSSHTVMGYKMIKALKFPTEIQLAALEHHEKENGTGYPRRLTGADINTFSKIVSVACAYEAITAKRDYKEERTAFEAMNELLKNQNKQYDDSIIKALLHSMSLYPVGTFVFLTNGKIAYVHSVDKNKPLNPFIKIIKKGDDGQSDIIQVDDEKIKISRVMNKKESQDAMKIMGGVNENAFSTQ